MNACGCGFVLRACLVHSDIIGGAMYFPEAPADLQRTRVSYIIE